MALPGSHAFFDARPVSGAEMVVNRTRRSHSGVVLVEMDGFEMVGMGLFSNQTAANGWIPNNTEYVHPCGTVKYESSQPLADYILVYNVAVPHTRLK